jgi:hypothetical protein
MHQLHEQIGGKLIGVFTDTIVVEEERTEYEKIEVDIKGKITFRHKTFKYWTF